MLVMPGIIVDDMIKLQDKPPFQNGEKVNVSLEGIAADSAGRRLANYRNVCKLFETAGDLPPEFDKIIEHPISFRETDFSDLQP